MGEERLVGQLNLVNHLSFFAKVHCMGTGRSCAQRGAQKVDDPPPSDRRRLLCKQNGNTCPFTACMM